MLQLQRELLSCGVWFSNRCFDLILAWFDISIGTFALCWSSEDHPGFKMQRQHKQILHRNPRDLSSLPHLPPRSGYQTNFIDRFTLDSQVWDLPFINHYIISVLGCPAFRQTKVTNTGIHQAFLWVKIMQAHGVADSCRFESNIFRLNIREMTPGLVIIRFSWMVYDLEISVFSECWVDWMIGELSSKVCRPDRCKHCGRVWHAPGTQCKEGSLWTWYATKWYEMCKESAAAMWWEHFAHINQY